MNFYDTITEQNAEEWYKSLPPHLRKIIDDKVAKFTPGRTTTKKESPALFEAVEKELGKRPLKPADPLDPLDGYTQDQLSQWEAHKKWGARYDELLLISIIVLNSEQIQRDRKMLSTALGLNDEEGKLPNQSVGLDDTQAATVRWLQESGQTPLEFLAATYRNDEAKIGDRISAARTLMDFVHRRVPVKTELETKDIGEAKLDPRMLSGLSEKELATLEALLVKMQVKNG